MQHYPFFEKFESVQLENYLSDVLDVRVDLIEKQSLKPAIGRHILKDAVPV